MNELDQIIEKYHQRTGLGYRDCVIDIFEEYNIDPYEARVCLTDETINKLKYEMITLNLAPKNICKPNENNISELFI